MTYARHDLLERPRDNPRRTALAAAVFSLVVVVFAAGSADRLFFQFGFGYEGAIWFFRAVFLVVPVVVYVLTNRICIQLARSDAHPLRGVGRADRHPQPGGRVRDRLGASAGPSGSRDGRALAPASPASLQNACK